MAISSSFCRRKSLDLFAASLFFRRLSQYASSFFSSGTGLIFLTRSASESRSVRRLRVDAIRLATADVPAAAAAAAAAAVRAAERGAGQGKIGLTGRGKVEGGKVVFVVYDDGEEDVAAVATAATWVVGGGIIGVERDWIDLCAYHRERALRSILQAAIGDPSKQSGDSLRAWGKCQER